MNPKEHFILLVEDDERLRKVLTLNLQARGYKVLQAGSFQQALDRIAIKPCLAILDINLPDASGWDVADWLETQDVVVPIIIMSGHGAPTAQQWGKFHPVAYLPKPFSIDRLMYLVQEYAQ
jgi:DNA-binding response OmpR family regulator